MSPDVKSPDSKPSAGSASPGTASPGSTGPAKTPSRGTPAVRDDDDGRAGGGLGAELAAAHDARVHGGVPDGVDARLDNRRGDQRPAAVQEWPAKPQQIDGPDLMHQDEFAAAALKDRRDGGDPNAGRAGMFSPGPHGTSPVEVRESDEPRYGTEGLTADELADGGSKDGERKSEKSDR